MTAIEDFERRYGGFFEELGYGCHASFKHLLEMVGSTIDTATADDVGLVTKLYSIESAKASIEVVAKYYSRFLPATVLNSLRAELEYLLDRVLEVAVDV
ncbi:hypothetical protein HRbin01_00604 [archaeon HR01]|nr:hypothetical protein HRbin01_00604 [archaeon HR01]